MNLKRAATLLGSMVTAIAASACCILPLLLGTASASAVGLGAAMAPYRPYLMTLTAVLLGIGFFLTYRPVRAGCRNGEAACVTNRSTLARQANMLVLWLVAFVSLGSMAYPWVASYRTETASAATPVLPDRNDKTVVFAIGNMTCEECMTSIVKALKHTRGVYRAKVDFAAKRATAQYDSKRVSAEQLRIAIGKTGFPASIPAQRTKSEQAANKVMQLPLTTLSDVAPLKEAFNRASGVTRMVLLVSPT